MNNKAGHFSYVLPAVFIAIGISIAGYFISQTLYNSRVALNTADVKGLAERRVEADKAYWTISYTVTGSSREEIPALYDKSEVDRKTIIATLIESGFTNDEIAPGVIRYNHEEYRDEDQKLVSEGRAKLNKLIAQGLDVVNNEPAYHYTKLNDIKPDMVKEATKNARIAANEFASNAGVKVGGIRSARQGGFEIRDVGERYGDTRKIEKEVRVVANVTFFLTD